MGFLSKLLTLGEGKQLKRYQAQVDKINGLEPQFQAQIGRASCRERV